MFVGQFLEPVVEAGLHTSAQQVAQSCLSEYFPSSSRLTSAPETDARATLLDAPASEAIVDLLTVQAMWHIWQRQGSGDLTALQFTRLLTFSPPNLHSRERTRPLFRLESAGQSSNFLLLLLLLLSSLLFSAITLFYLPHKSQWPTRSKRFLTCRASSSRTASNS